METREFCNNFAADILCKKKWPQTYYDIGSQHHGLKRLPVDSLEA